MQELYQKSEIGHVRAVGRRSAAVGGRSAAVGRRSAAVGGRSAAAGGGAGTNVSGGMDATNLQKSEPPFFHPFFLLGRA